MGCGRSEKIHTHELTRSVLVQLTDKQRAALAALWRQELIDTPNSVVGARYLRLCLLPADEAK